MATIIIVKNISGSTLQIKDLGIILAAGESRALTENFNKIDISKSTDLFNAINTDLCIINNGITDLSKDDSFLEINFKTEFENPSLPGIFNLTTEPSDHSVVWLNPNINNIPYSWNPNTGSFISVQRQLYTYFQPGNANGIYMTIGGHPGCDYYFIGRPSVITSIYAKNLSGATSKTFTIKNDNTNLFSFTTVNSKYINLTPNINISADTLLRVLISNVGSKITDTIVQIEMALT